VTHDLFPVVGISLSWLFTLSKSRTVHLFCRHIQSYFQCARNRFEKKVIAPEAMLQAMKTAITNICLMVFFSLLIPVDFWLFTLIIPKKPRASST
jgi:hypothetical protein